MTGGARVENIAYDDGHRLHSNARCEVASYNHILADRAAGVIDVVNEATVTVACVVNGREFYSDVGAGRHRRRPGCG